MRISFHMLKTSQSGDLCGPESSAQIHAFVDRTPTTIVSAMRILKDKIFERTRAFNIVQMTDFLVHRLSRYYEMKLLDAAHNRLLSLSKFLKFSPRANESIVQHPNETDVFIVDSSTGVGSYSVDTLACTCTCVVGVNGKPCKHQFWVAQAKELDMFTLTPRTMSMRTMWFKLATGKEPPVHWLANLHDGPPSTAAVSRVVVPQQVVATCSLLNMVEGDEHRMETAPQNMSNGEVVNRLLHDIGNYFNTTLLKVTENDPDQFVKPLQEFLKTCESLKTANSIVSALHTFGKYSGVSGRNQRGRINVQPTALQRRVKEIRGKAAGQSGRLKKNVVAKVLGHDYAMPHRLVRAPHDLAACVSKNISLGKSHNK